jgi:hypothetical protein
VIVFVHQSQSATLVSSGVELGGGNATCKPNFLKNALLSKTNATKKKLQVLP